MTLLNEFVHTEKSCVYTLVKIILNFVIIPIVKFINIYNYIECIISLLFSARYYVRLE